MKAVKVLAILIDDWERNIWLLSDGHFLQIHLSNTGCTAVLCLPSPEHGAHIQMSQPLALSGLYPQILSFHKLANFQHFILASGLGQKVSCHKYEVQTSS